MAYDKLEICNLAMGYLRATRISSLDEKTPQAGYCKDVWQVALDVTLLAYDWSAAKFEARLALANSTPLLNWAHKYALPADPHCLKVIQLNHADDEFEQVGRYLYTDADVADVVYIGRLHELKHLPFIDGNLADCIALQLAWKVGGKLSGKQKLAEAALTMFELRVSEASTIDARAGGRRRENEQPRANDWQTARGGY